MGKKNRVRRERAAGRRKPIQERRDKEPTTVEQWRAYNRKVFREARENGFAGMDGLEGLEIPELGSTRSMFKPEPTDEPGTMYECEDCGWRGYLEGIFSTHSNPAGIQATESVIFGMCPECQGNMYGVDEVILNGPDGGIAASHPAGLQFALERLLGKVKSGDVTPDEAIAVLRQEPMLRRVVDQIEAHPAVSTITASFVTTLIGVLLTVLFTSGGDEPMPVPTITPEQVEQIVESVVSKIEDGDADGPAERIPPGRTD